MLIVPELTINVRNSVTCQSESVEPGPNPPDLYDVQVGRMTDPKPDFVPPGGGGAAAFGDVVTQPEAAYAAGETVTARFRAGNPWLASKVQCF